MTIKLFEPNAWNRGVKWWICSHCFNQLHSLFWFNKMTKTIYSKAEKNVCLIRILSAFSFCTFDIIATVCERVCCNHWISFVAETKVQGLNLLMLIFCSPTTYHFPHVVRAQMFLANSSVCLDLNHFCLYVHFWVLWQQYFSFALSANLIWPTFKNIQERGLNTVNRTFLYTQ